MKLSENILEELSKLNPKISEDIIKHSTVQTIPANTELIRSGEYVKVIPIVTNGAIKVYVKHNDKELLLYYIESNDSCVMSFTSGLNNTTSKVFAVTEKETTVLLLPVNKIRAWIIDFPEINALFLNQYNLRYLELLDSVTNILFNKMDKRLHNYLIDKYKFSKENPIKISHKKISNELGSAREVVSRTMKKLEQEGKVKQLTSSIKLLEW